MQLYVVWWWYERNYDALWNGDMQCSAGEKYANVVL